MLLQVAMHAVQPRPYTDLPSALQDAAQKTCAKGNSVEVVYGCLYRYCTYATTPLLRGKRDPYVGFAD